MISTTTIHSRTFEHLQCVHIRRSDECDELVNMFG